MNKPNEPGNRQSGQEFEIALNGYGFIAPLREGYSRKGGQNVAPAANSPRPPAPPPFRPATGPSTSHAGNKK